MGLLVFLFSHLQTLPRLRATRSGGLEGEGTRGGLDATDCGVTAPPLLATDGLAS